MDYAALKTEGYNPKTANIDKVSSLEIAELINEQDRRKSSTAGCRRH